MSNFNCTCNNNCVSLSIYASIFIGIITAILRITATITLTPAFLWVLFGIAVVYLAVLLISAPFNKERICLCQTLPVLITGILGTILTSVILLGIEFVATSIIGAIISGALLLFFSLLITTASCYIRCAVNCD